MKWPLIFVALTFSSLVSAEDCSRYSGADGFSEFRDLLELTSAIQQSPRMEFDLASDGSFELELTFEFPENLPLKTIFERILDPAEIIAQSNIIKEVTYPDLKGKPSIQVSEEPQQVLTKGCKHLSCSTTRSQCRFATAKQTEIEYRCELDTRHRETALRFVRGTSSYRCNTHVDAPSTCTFKVTGLPKNYDSLFYSRTPQELAAAGAVETAIGIIQLVNPLTLFKASTERLLGATSTQFYPVLMKEIKTQPKKSVDLFFDQKNMKFSQRTPN